MVPIDECVKILVMLLLIEFVSVLNDCILISLFFFQELFVEMIAKDALVYAQQGKRKTLQRKDLGQCCFKINK